MSEREQRNIIQGNEERKAGGREASEREGSREGRESERERRASA